MDQFKWRAVYTVFVCLASVVVLLVLWQARFIFLLLFAGCIGALILATLTSKFQLWFRIRRRGIAFALVIVAVAGVFASSIWLRGPALVQELVALRADIAAAARELIFRLQAMEWGRWVIAHSEDSSQASRALSMTISGVGGAIYGTVSMIAGLFLVTITSVYLAAEPDFYLRGIRRILPTRKRATIESCFEAATRMLRAWLRAKAVSMISIGVFIAAGLFILHIPLAGTLGIIAALMTFIPNIGAILSFIPAGLLAFAVSPVTGLLTLALYCLAHFLEGNIITPLAERTIVRLPPALTLALQLLLASVAGGLGVVMAAPLTAVLLSVADVLLPPESCNSRPDSLQADTPAEKLDSRVQAS